MKQAFGIFAALVLIPSLQVQAWIGGPWSNDTYQSNGDDGIYEAVATMTNGVGLYRWAVQNNTAGGTPLTGSAANGAQTSNVMFGGLIGASSPHIWYYKGLTYYGRCFGIVNSSMGIVSVTGNAANDGLDGSVNGLPINGVNLASTGVPTVAGAAIPPTVSQAGGGNNKGYANSNFIAKIKDKSFNKRFKGKGKVTFSGALDVSSSIYTTTLNIDTNGDGVNDTVVNTVHNTLNGETPNFSQIGHKRTFIVFGTQVSTVVTS